MLYRVVLVVVSIIAVTGCAPEHESTPRPAASAGDERVPPSVEEEAPDPVSLQPSDGRDLIETPEQTYARVFGTCPMRDPKLAAAFDANRSHNLGAVDPGPSFGMSGADAGELRVIIMNNIGDLEDCYRRATEIWPKLSGHVALRFAISNRDGTVVDSRVESNDTGNTALACCMARKPPAWTFPVRGDDSYIVVTYPFTLDHR